MLFTATLGLPALLLGAGLAGWLFRRGLGPHHRDRETVDALRVIMSMMVTFAALVLGLLTSSAKSDFDAQLRGVGNFGVELIELNERLREYGHGVDMVRTGLRRYTAAVIASSWPHEPAPPGNYPHLVDVVPGDLGESRTMSALLLSLDEQLGSLVPSTPFQQQLLPVLRGNTSTVLHRRWQLVVATSAVAWPFLGVLSLWLALAFFIFGLSTPWTRLNVLVLALAAVSVAAAVYLVVDFGTPFAGLFNLPSTPLRDALSHMDMDAPLPR